MEGSIEKKRKASVSKDEVIAKLKDDGDFDNLRRKIIRRLKDNEQLRDNILSIVRQSSALNRAGAENMKPRQLSDAIYEEVGDKMMNQVSDGVWEIIRSANGMKQEITETVQSVYNKLVEPEKKEQEESSIKDAMQVQNEAEIEGTVGASGGLVDGNLSDSDLNEPPGFSLPNNHQNGNNEDKDEVKLPVHCEVPMQEQKECPTYAKDAQVVDVDHGVPHGFSADVGHEEPCNNSDEDPDVPPGFG